LQITEGDEKGRTLTWYGYFTDKTVERTLESMRFMGWTGEDPTNPTNLDANEVEIVVEPEDYTNDKGETKTRSRVRWINRAGGLALKTRLDDAKKASLAERIRGHVAKVDQKLQAEGAGADGKPKGDVPF
jgi:hypothetical protein